jgi:hypothetical protein
VEPARPLSVRCCEGAADAEKIADMLNPSHAGSEEERPPVSVEAVQPFFREDWGHTSPFDLRSCLAGSL